MEKKAAALLGDDVEAGSIVSTTGTVKSIMKGSISGSVGGIVGGAIGGAAVEALTDRGRPALDFEGHQGLMYLAIGRTKVALFTIKQGMLGSSPQKLLVSLPRESVASVELGSGSLSSPVTVTLTDGSRVAMEVTRLNRGKVERIAKLFGTPSS